MVMVFIELVARCWWVMELENHPICLVTVQTKYWLNTQVRGQHIMIQGNPDLEICFFAKRSVTSILCLIIPVVGQISWCKCSSPSVLWLLNIEQSGSVLSPINTYVGQQKPHGCSVLLLLIAFHWTKQLDEYSLLYSFHLSNQLDL